MKNGRSHLLKTPWDSRALGMDTYEILDLSPEALEEAALLKGHFTVRVDTKAPRDLLDSNGFYYCDTLIEPCCEAERFIHFRDERASLSRDVPLETLLAICHGAFYGRFHRDFNIPRAQADLRYDLWLKDLFEQGRVYALVFGREVAGFLAYTGHALCLHAIAQDYRGRGIAKYLWDAACTELYKNGHEELTSSISVSNLPALNLYASLGFRFRKPVDVYHKLNKRLE